MLETIYIGNDILVVLEDLRDQSTGDEVTGAAVSIVRMEDLEGNAVTGFTPIQMTLKAGTTNTYQAAIPQSVVNGLTEGDVYRIVVEVSQPSKAEWEVPVIVRRRERYADN